MAWHQAHPAPVVLPIGPPAPPVKSPTAPKAKPVTTGLPNFQWRDAGELADGIKAGIDNLIGDTGDLVENITTVLGSAFMDVGECVLRGGIGGVSPVLGIISDLMGGPDCSLDRLRRIAEGVAELITGLVDAANEAVETGETRPLVSALMGLLGANEADCLRSILYCIGRVAPMALVGALVGFGSGKIASALSSKLKVTKNLNPSRGSTGRTISNNWAESLAMDKVLKKPEGIHLKKVKMNDPRWDAKEGSEKWAQNADGVEIHYVRNRITGAVDDFKFVDKPK